jgi:hypothetical protein
LWYYLLPLAGIRYFKREQQKKQVGRHKLLPISMGIPADAIETIAPAAKTKDWVNYNVDPGLKDLFAADRSAATGQRHFVFENAAAYNADLRASRFGITTRRAGWDCLRHYEYAAKGVVLCFRDLHLKPPACAPHGLDASNCIIYKSREDLLAQIDNLTPEQYARLQAGGYAWVRRHTTVAVALRFLALALQP